MNGQASISAEILGRYAADAAREIPGVRKLARRRSVKIAADGDSVLVEIHLVVDWGSSIPDLARGVQTRVRQYLLRMADVEPAQVEVVVDEIGPRG
jgi:uncharacterized alkaline shock family protein YloU